MIWTDTSTCSCEHACCTTNVQNPWQKSYSFHFQRNVHSPCICIGNTSHWSYLCMVLWRCFMSTFIRKHFFMIIPINISQQYSYHSFLPLPPSVSLYIIKLWKVYLRCKESSIRFSWISTIRSLCAMTFNRILVITFLFGYLCNSQRVAKFWVSWWNDDGAIL